MLGTIYIGDAEIEIISHLKKEKKFRISNGILCFEKINYPKAKIDFNMTVH